MAEETNYRMITHQDIVNKYNTQYLICDSAYPLISNSYLYEEAILYNLDIDKTNKVLDLFTRMTSKRLSLIDDLTSLSGGQKVLIMVLMALHSKAQNICFINLSNCLDQNNSSVVFELINGMKPLKNEILFL